MTKEEYRRQIRALRLVLEGKKDKLIREMEENMQAASAALQFEKAARLRDDIDALKNLVRKYKSLGESFQVIEELPS